MAVNEREVDLSVQYELLKKLQNECSWDIIVYCFWENCPWQLWMPSQRIFPDPLNHYDYVMNDLFNLAQIIKEPDYNPMSLIINPYA